METKKLNALYLSALRSRKKGGARWQRVREVSADKVIADNDLNKDGRIAEFPQHFNVTTFIHNEEIASEVKSRVHKLLELSKQILTERQYAVFVLMAVKEPTLTEREVAKVLSISPGRVHQLNTAAMTKLRRAYDERTA